MFNLSGGEIVVLLLIGLVVLGPEKLPDAMRKFGRVYNEVRRVATGIQRDVTSTFAEPVSELRKTANEAKRIFSGDGNDRTGQEATEADPPFVPYEPPGTSSSSGSGNEGVDTTQGREDDDAPR